MTNWKLIPLCVVVVSVPITRGLAANGEISFTRDIRPILSEHCFRCHGFDGTTREAGLRLDRVDSATSQLESGSIAVVPGSIVESELVSRIRSDDESVVMPPPEIGKPLSEQQKNLLERWIEGGAAYERHWAFIAPTCPPLPPVKDTAWVRNPIDHFVLARLESSRVGPSGEASKEKLLRRVTLDLTGLPPTIRELDDFLADPREDAYEKAVDRLLKSDRYGEHRARYWLDAARYGDTHGMARDDERSIWPYRDWVIRAFNNNMPFDEFTIRQLAGDLLPNPTLDDRIATGFVRCNVSTAEGGSIEEELIVNYARDRVDTMSTVWMGLTLGCATCHDHKYDPCSQKEYYQLVAYFNNLTEEPMNGNALAPDPVVRVPNEAQAAELKELDRLRVQLNETRTRALRSLESDFERWISSARLNALRSQLQQSAPRLPSWYGSKSFHRKDNTAVYFDEAFSVEEQIELNNEQHGWTPLAEGDGMPIVVSDDNCARFFFRDLNVGWPRTFTLTLASEERLWKPIRWKVWLRGELIFFRQFRQADVPFSIELPIDLLPGSNELLIRASHFGGPLRGRITLTVSDPLSEQETLHSAVDAISNGKASPQQRAAVRQYFERHLWSTGQSSETLASGNALINREDSNVDSVQHRMLRLKQRQFALEANIPVSMVCEERDTQRETFLLVRGRYDLPQERINRGVPAVLPPLPQPLSIPSGGSRLDLARWLVHEDHPLTARVAVNRIWQQCFGVGLVKTSEDFGSQGEYPSHPDLLDWLADDFRAHGWNVKRLIRMIVVSATYRQSSVVRPRIRDIDPENRLLARGVSYRLDAEVIRDQALFVGGLLREQLGGRGVKPPQPEGLWLAVSQPNSSTAQFVADPRDDQSRRSVYSFWKRTSPPPVLQTFDAPTRESCIVRRERTNTPLQALLLMNEEQFFQSARGLAKRMLNSEVSDAERLSLGFRMLTSRYPAKSELDQLEKTLGRLRAHYRAHSDEAKRLAAEANENEEQAAWIMTANVLLNLSEAITKE